MAGIPPFAQGGHKKTTPKKPRVNAQEMAQNPALELKPRLGRVTCRVWEAQTPVFGLKAPNFFRPCGRKKKIGAAQKKSKTKSGQIGMKTGGFPPSAMATNVASTPALPSRPRVLSDKCAYGDILLVVATAHCCACTVSTHRVACSTLALPAARVLLCSTHKCRGLFSLAQSITSYRRAMMGSPPRARIPFNKKVTVEGRTGMAGRLT